MFPFPVYSSDSHIIEPPELWTERIEPKFKERAPRVANLEDSDLWVVEDNLCMAVVGIQNQAGLRFDNPEKITKSGRYEEIPLLDPDRYVEDLDKDGVLGAVVYSSNAHQAYRYAQPDLMNAIARAYNDWILEYCNTYPHKLKTVTLINVDEPEEAVQEMQRTAKLGAAGFMLPLLPLPGCRYDQPQYEIIWSVAEDLDLPLSFHVGCNRAVLGREPVIDLLAHQIKDINVQASIATLIFSGVFARHPKLRLVAVEFGTSWAIHLMNRMDGIYKKNRGRGNYDFSDQELPSDRFRQNIYVTFQEDIPGIRFRDVIGVDNMMWGNDYPHAESTFPRSQKFLTEHFLGVDECDCVKIAGENTRKLYRF